MNKNLLALVAVALLAGPMAAQAIPTTVSAGESVLWNFDLSGQSPAPPYSAGLFQPGLASFDFADSGTYSFFSDLNGGGTQFLSDVFVNQVLLGLNSPDSNDGVWSLRLTMTAGSVNVDPCFEGFLAGRGTGCIAGTLVTTVPEPGTLALFGLGLAGLGFARRRRAAN